MKRYWEQLKPQERRWAVGIGAVVFLMLNWFFVWPHRHDWGRDGARMQAALATNKLYRAEIAHKDEYVRRLRELQADGSEVLPEDQAIDFIHFYTSRQVAHHIIPLNNGPLVTRTNDPFFVEQQMGISVQADETNLVNFLYSLSEGSSMMRVRAMSLHPDPNHQQLNASLTLVASYQKKASVRGAAGSGPGRAGSTASVTPASTKPAAPLVITPAPAVASLPPQAAARPPGTFPAAPGAIPQPPSFHFNTPGSSANPTDRTNRVAGAFARSNALKKTVTNAQ